MIDHVINTIITLIYYSGVISICLGFAFGFMIMCYSTWRFLRQTLFRR